MPHIVARIVIGLLLLGAVATVALWAASEYGQIEVTVHGPNPGGTTTVWVSGGVASSLWFTGGGGKPAAVFTWFVRDKGGQWVAADFGPSPGIVGYFDNGVPVIYGERFVVAKRHDACEWPFLSVEIDENATPQLRKLSLWCLVVVSMLWPMWIFGKRLLTNHSIRMAVGRGC